MLGIRLTMTSDTVARHRPRRLVDGILLLDKPSGMSSNRALQRVKALFNAHKAGHTGSLDPLATGMLPICLGDGTKMAGHLLDAEKLYRVQLAFGLETSTGDAEGLTQARGVEAVERRSLEVVLRLFLGTSLQIPPMHSALKLNGRPLYRLARTGHTVDRAPRQITIRDLAIEEYDPHVPVLRVRCSKGTYIRTLVEDIARKAGTVAHVAELRRICIWPFSGQAMIDLEHLERVAVESPGDLDRLLLPMDAALGALPEVHLGPAETGRLRQGQAVDEVDAPGPAKDSLVRLYGPGSQFLGVGERDSQGRILPRRLVRASIRSPRPSAGCN
ncbi:tRNA pseudouridine synthase B [Gammaproteobacteria bacterium]|nr:tRNA pseudouridine synthase B [Gammaproteobacteria bacterium]